MLFVWGLFGGGYHTYCFLYCWVIYSIYSYRNSIRKGINSSIIGQFLENKYGVKEDKKSILDDDLDNDK